MAMGSSRCRADPRGGCAVQPHPRRAELHGSRAPGSPWRGIELLKRNRLTGPGRRPGPGTTFFSLWRGCNALTIPYERALTAALIALAIAALLPSVADALPKPGAKPRGFRLFARSGSVLGALTGNRVYCGLATDGRVCVDSTNSSTIGGGFWPKGTPDQYVFNSGLQLAGIIGTDGGVWAGDTVGAFSSTRRAPRSTASRSTFRASRAPHSGPVQLVARRRPGRVAGCRLRAERRQYGQLLRPGAADRCGQRGQPNCRKFASQQDVWFLSWEGNPALNAGRKHPLRHHGRNSGHDLELPGRQRGHPVLHLYLL
mgnify:CR=1 FL=1